MTPNLTPEEQHWRDQLRRDEVPLEAGDWAAMSSLLDTSRDGGLAGGDPGPVPGPALPTHWARTLLTGLLVGLLAVALTPDNPQARGEEAFLPPQPAAMDTLLRAEAGEDEHARMGLAMTEDEAVDAGKGSLAEGRGPRTENLDQRLDSSPQNEALTSSSLSAVGNVKTRTPSLSNTQKLINSKTQEITRKTLPLTPVAPETEQPGASRETAFGSRATSGRQADNSQLTTLFTDLAPVSSQSDPGQALPNTLQSAPWTSSWEFGSILGGHFSIPEGKGSGALRPHLGLFVNRSVAPGWRVQAELALRSIPVSLQRERGGTILNDFGEATLLSQEASTDGFLALELPILAVRELGRHRLLAGVRVSRLWPDGDASALEYQGTTFNTIPSLEITDGIRHWDVGLSLGYAFRLTPALALQARYNQGLLDLTHDNFFNNDQTTLNNDWQLSVRWHW